MTTRPLGLHYLIEYYDCDSEIISSPIQIRKILLEATQKSNATIVADVFHSFNPHGVSGVVVIAESHVAIHTWPEHRCASVDIFSCSKKMDPIMIQTFLHSAFAAKSVMSTEIKRGLIPIK